MFAKMRSTNPCDGCSLRRVRCEGGHPCIECQNRSISCTFLRPKKKRGPKGPRTETGHKIERFQAKLNGNGDQDGKHIHSRPKLTSLAADASRETLINFPLESYQWYLDIFHQRLYPVWPIISRDELINRLQNDESDFESHALASALCAATIAQLRLRDDKAPFDSISAHDFGADAERLRRCFDHREHYTLSSLLTSFFLHIYFANVDKLRTSGFFLREALTYAHGLRLHQPDTYADADPVSRQLRLRIYWILFVSERTYCVQNGLPATLKTINVLPSAEMMDGYDSTLLPAFLSLTRLFTYLEGHFLEATVTCTDFHVTNEQPDQISTFQNDLSQEHDEEELNESQKVDIFVTRSWIRILLWQYTIMHFAVSCHAQDDAFSAFLPASVAYDMLSFFTKVSKSSIEPHGYGMELKIFRVADSLLDVLACTHTLNKSQGLLFNSRDSLHSLEIILHMVGGTDSLFLKQLRERMAALGLPIAPSLWAECQLWNITQKRLESNSEEGSSRRRQILCHSCQD